jgi:hypothetical protein
VHGTACLDSGANLFLFKSDFNMSLIAPEKASAAAAFFFFGGMPKMSLRGVLNRQQPSLLSFRLRCPDIEQALLLPR